MIIGNNKSTSFVERPEHKVCISDFYLCEIPVTQRLWISVMGNNPSFFQGSSRPVEQVSWLDTRRMIEKLNQNDELLRFFEDQDLGVLKFRLPTESEWEYAARGGVYHQGYEFSGSDRLEQVGWHKNNSKNQTKPVKELEANELGLFDMSGNVWEWCEDDWHGSYQNAPDDSTPWVDAPRNSVRVFRGGAFYYDSYFCSVFYRGGDEAEVKYNSIGFRLALSYL